MTTIMLMANAYHIIIFTCHNPCRVLILNVTYPSNLLHPIYPQTIGIEMRDQFSYHRHQSIRHAFQFLLFTGNEPEILRDATNKPILFLSQNFINFMR